MLILFLSFIHKNTFAQQFNNWIFHNNNGITFNTNPPSFLGGGQIENTLSSYSTASISDRNGNLIFYSDGERVWNKNNLLMPNGFGLLGGNASINTVLIVPFINDTNKYYLFTSKGLIFHTPGDEANYQYCYSVIDMHLNGGLGDVINKNTFIKFFANEKMVAVPNSNGNDIWWICRDWTNLFYIYKINCTGFQNNNPVICTVGANVNNDANLLIAGEIKASSDAKKIAICYSNYFEIYQFNSSTGLLSNSIKIPTVGCYGLEFSPNSKLLYLTQTFIINQQSYTDVVQYNLANYDSTAISNSLVKITNSQSTGIAYDGGMQLGPDNKIYRCGQGNFYLSIIATPNNLGAGCGYQETYVTLQNPTFQRLPYSYVNLITAQNVQISYTVAPDCRTVTFNAKTYIKGNNLTFKWKWGEPPPVAGTAADSATQVVPSGGDTTYTTITHTYPPGIDTFFVGLAVTSDTLCGTGRAGARVVVKPPKPTANFGFASTCNSLNVVFTDSSQLNFNPSLSYQYAFKPALAPPIAYSNFSTAPNNNYTFAAYDSFDVRLIVRSPLGCVQADTIVKRVVLKAKPTAGFTYTNNCGSLQATFTNTATIAAGSIAVYEYYLGNTLIGSGSSNVVYTFPAYCSYTVKQVVKSNFNCVSDTVGLPVVIIKAKPALSLAVLQDSVCTNTTFTITAAASVAASSISNYTWLRNGVVLPTTANQITDNQPTGTYVYKAIANAATGCKSDTATQIMTVVSEPTATLTATNICGSKQINITSTTNVVNDNISNYYLDYGDGNTSTGNPNNTTYTYANYGSYTLKYVPKSSVGCAADTVFFPIVVKDKPVLTLSVLQDSVCLGTSCTIAAAASVAASSISNYTWLRNGVVLPTTASQITDNQPTGTYVYKAIANAATGCKSDTANQIITVVSKPTATVTATNICGSKQINITSTTNVVNDNISNYYLDYGDGNTSTGNPNNTTYTYANYGSYTLKYVPKSSVGCAADTVFFPIVVKDKPVVSIAYNNDACQNTNYVLTATASVNSSSIASYTWVRNGVVLPTTSSILTENNIAGNYTYQVVAVSALGCKSDTVSQNVVVEKYPTTAFTAAGGCVGRNIVITNSSINNPTTTGGASSSLTYAWTTSDGHTSTAAVPAFNFATSGPKTITLTATSQNGCATPLTKNITVDAFPTAAFDITEACLGKPIAITNNSTGAISNYNWQVLGSAQTSTATVPNFTFNSEGNYSIKLEVSTPNNCTDAISKTTSIRAVRLFTTPAVDTNAIINQPIQLGISGAATYTWSPGFNLNSATGNNPIFTSPVLGVYPLQIQGTTAQGCKGNASLTVKVFVGGTYVWIPGAFTPNGDGLNDRLRILCSGLKALTGFTIYNRYGQKVYEQTSCNSNGWNGFFNGILQPTGNFVYTWQGVAFDGKIVSGKGSVILIR